jgi:hypothetical protein
MIPATAPVLRLFDGALPMLIPFSSACLSVGGMTWASSDCIAPVTGTLGATEFVADAVDVVGSIDVCGNVPVKEVTSSSRLELLLADGTGIGSMVPRRDSCGVFVEVMELEDLVEVTEDGAVVDREDDVSVSDVPLVEVVEVSEGKLVDVPEGEVVDATEDEDGDVAEEVLSALVEALRWPAEL